MAKKRKKSDSRRKRGIRLITPRLTKKMHREKFKVVVPWVNLTPTLEQIQGYKERQRVLESSQSMDFVLKLTKF